MIPVYSASYFRELEPHVQLIINGTPLRAFYATRVLALEYVEEEGKKATLRCVIEDPVSLWWSVPFVKVGDSVMLEIGYRLEYELRGPFRVEKARPMFLENGLRIEIEADAGGSLLTTANNRVFTDGTIRDLFERVIQEHALAFSPRGMGFVLDTPVAEVGAFVQSNESDGAFLSRIVRRYGWRMTISGREVSLTPAFFNERVSSAILKFDASDAAIIDPEVVMKTVYPPSRDPASREPPENNAQEEACLALGFVRPGAAPDALTSLISASGNPAATTNMSEALGVSAEAVSAIREGRYSDAASSTLNALGLAGSSAASVVGGLVPEGGLDGVLESFEGSLRGLSEGLGAAAGLGTPEGAVRPQAPAPPRRAATPAGPLARGNAGWSWFDAHEAIFRDLETPLTFAESETDRYTRDVGVRLRADGTLSEEVVSSVLTGEWIGEAGHEPQAPEQTTSLDPVVESESRARASASSVRYLVKFTMPFAAVRLVPKTQLGLRNLGPRVSGDNYRVQKATVILDEGGLYGKIECGRTFPALEPLLDIETLDGQRAEGVDVVDSLGAAGGYSEAPSTTALSGGFSSYEEAVQLREDGTIEYLGGVLLNDDGVAVGSSR